MDKASAMPFPETTLTLRSPGFSVAMMPLTGLPSTCATMFVLRAGMQSGSAVGQDVTMSGALDAHGSLSQYASHGGKAFRLVRGSVVAAIVAPICADNINASMRRA